jgi:methylthioribose-1-phosphate isomerase
MMKAIEWRGDRVIILDQTRLPRKEVYLELSRPREIASAIAGLKIRGAPASGVAGGYAVALGALGITASAKAGFIKELKDIIQTIAATRPTAR